MVVERAEHARARGAKVWGQIDGYAVGFEPTLTSAAPVTTGIEATQRRALNLSRHDARAVSLVLASAHGTSVDRLERDAIRNVLGSDSAARVFAPKVRLGETFGASGALALCLAAAPSLPAVGAGTDPSVVLINSLCYSGNVVSLLFTRAEGSHE